MKRLLSCVLPAALLAVVGCDGGSGTGGSGGTGGAGGSGGSTTTSTTVTSSTTSSTSTGTPTVANCENGQELVFGQAMIGGLDNPGQEDFFKFEGLKGQVLFIEIDAQDIDQVTFDPTYIDTTVTLVDLNGDRIAQNDNPTEFTSADSRLYTILPADGTYCVKVSECWTAKSNPGTQCLEPQEKTSTYYELYVFELIDDGPGDANTADPEGGNDPTSATTVDFVQADDGTYFTGYIWGYFETDTDIDVYSMTLPPDLPVSVGARAAASVSTFPTGVSGNGSTSPTGDILIFDPATPDIPIARIDPGQTDQIRAPLELDKEYWLFVNRAPGAVEENDFYIVSARPAWGNPVETDDVNNSSFATAEIIDFSDADSAFVEGDLIPITDLDHFKVDVPGGQTLVTAVCGARTQGSGLRQMKITLLGEDGMPLSAAASDIETATQLAYVQDIPIGNNATVVLKVEAPTQAADTSGSYYQCGVHFSSP